MQHYFKIIGVSHHLSGIDERVRFGEQLAQFQALVKEKYPAINEHLILSTCNRSEIYLASDNETTELDDFDSFVKSYFSDFSSLYLYHERGALEYFFRLVCGLDSLAIGENQIVSQIKDAYFKAIQDRTVSFVLHKVVQEGFRVAKLIRSGTSICRGSLSIASLAVHQATKIFGGLEGRSAIVLGAGQTGALVSRYLKDQGIGSLFIVNRTFNKAQELANSVAGIPVALDNFHSLVPIADIFVAAVSGLDDKNIVAPSIFTNRSRDSNELSPFCVLDLSVPSLLNMTGLEDEDIYSFKVDDLKAMVDANIVLRKEEVSRACEIIMTEVDAVANWFGTHKSASRFATFADSLIVDDRLRALTNLDEADYISFIKSSMYKLFKKLRLNRGSVQHNHQITHLKEQILAELGLNVNS